VRVASGVPQDLNEIAFDPQTSGGLLIAIPEREVEALTRDLVAAGVLAAAVIGEVVSHTDGWVELG
jgi:selenide,water dikinase